MDSQLINVLIRTSNRPTLFKRAIDSVWNQTYSNFRIIIACDSPEALAYAEEEKGSNVDIFYVGLNKDQKIDHYWNLYCNQLKARVYNGWFFYLDDDDYLFRFDALENIAKHLINPDEGVICQYMRNGWAKPSKELLEAGRIEKGRIGAPSLFLHSKNRFVADWDGHQAGDYRWIRDVAAVVPMKFVPVVVVQTGNNGLHGK